jgi:hypothetical protein
MHKLEFFNFIVFSPRLNMSGGIGDVSRVNSLVLTPTSMEICTAQASCEGVWVAVVFHVPFPRCIPPQQEHRKLPRNCRHSVTPQRVYGVNQRDNIVTNGGVGDLALAAATHVLIVKSEMLSSFSSIIAANARFSFVFN